MRALTHLASLTLALSLLPAGALAEERPADGKPGARGNSHHPILFFQGSTGVVLGGSRQGRWIKRKDLPMKRLAKVKGDRLDAREVETALVRGDEEFSIYTSRGRFGRVRATGRPVFWVMPSSGSECLEVALTGKGKVAPPALGVHGDWDAMPRRPRPLGKNTFALDVDKDGVAETIRRRDSQVTAEEDGKPIRKLRSSLELIKGTKVSTIHRFEQEPHYTDNYSWFAIDLDGDGDLEIVTFDEGHNATLRVYDATPAGAWVVVLAFYWGD